MEHYCLHIGKVITGLGLFMDIIGVVILVNIDLILRKIGVLKNKVVSEDTKGRNQSASDISGGQPIDVPEDFFLELVNSPERNFSRSKWGFGLIICGFTMQLISLFVNECISL